METTYSDSSEPQCKYSISFSTHGKLSELHPTRQLALYTRPRTPPITFPIGHLSTGDTPSHPKPLSTPANEVAPVVDKTILEELHGNIIAIKPEAFIRNLMYGREKDPTTDHAERTELLSSSERWARDKFLAEECFQALGSRQQSQKFNYVIASLATDRISIMEVAERVSPYTSNKFAKLDRSRREWDLYEPLVALFQFIDQFFRCYFIESTGNRDWNVEVDKSWPVAADPKEHHLDQKPARFLKRGFFDTNDKRFHFSHHIQEPPALRPDISFVLYEKTDSPELPEFKELHWKDIKVPIEVKLQGGFDLGKVCQMARYARAIHLEQFDRNFTFTLLVSKNKCRVFHWDASHCHVAEVDMHKDPVTFIQIIGRLASMDPWSMGYDARFSNSGRVLASQSERMATTLEVVSGTPTQFHDQRPGTEAKNTMILDLCVNRPLFAARGFLFSRHTRVWEGREIVGTDQERPEHPLRAVKQNWAEMERVNEAFLYEKTNEVPNLARLMGSEAGSRTIDVASSWNPGDILGVYRKGRLPAEPLPPLDLPSDEERFHLHKYNDYPRRLRRVLVRMVFKEKGRSVFEVRDCQELLQATKQWVIGLCSLNKIGILHRDVSSGNLLLGHDMNSPAFIIDLGLAHWSELSEDGSTYQPENGITTKAHHHLTGTLPFIAYELLAARAKNRFIKHEVYHDVESVFWVVLYVVLLTERSDEARQAFNRLLSTDVGVVCDRKISFLLKDLKPDDPYGLEFFGRFKDLAPFLGRFAGIVWDWPNNPPKLEDIINIIDDAISTLPSGAGENETTFTSALSSKRKLEPVEGPDELGDDALPEHTGSDSRNVRQRVE